MPIQNFIKNRKTVVIFDQMIASGCNFILGILLARYLGIEKYGIFSLLWLVVLFASSLQLAFLVTPLLTFGPKRKGVSLKLFLSNMLYVQIFFGISSIFILSLFLKVAPLFNSQWHIEPSLFYSLLAVTFVFLLQDFLRRIFIVNSRFWMLVISDVIAYIGQIATISLLITSNEVSLNNVLYTLIGSFGLSIAVSFSNLEFYPPNLRYCTSLIIKNWNYSRWLIYSAVLQWGSGNYFILAAGSILGVWAVGAIKLIQNLMGVFHVIFLALENILPVSFSQIFHREGLNHLLVYSRKLIVYGIVGFTCLVVLSVPFSDHLLTVLYGADKSKYSFLLIWFLIIYFFIYLGMIERYILRTIDSTKIIFYGYVINLIFSLSFSTLLIDTMGIAGVAVGMLVIQIVMNSMMQYTITKRKNRLILWK